MLLSRQKTVVKLSISVTMCLSQFLCLSLSLFFSPLTPPPSLSLSLCRSYSLPATLFVCDSGDSSFLMLYFSLVLFLYLSEACTLSISLSWKLVLSLTLSLFVCHFLTLSNCNYRFPWLEEMGRTRHASTPLIETQPYLPSFACQTLSGESG